MKISRNPNNKRKVSIPYANPKDDGRTRIMISLGLVDTDTIERPALVRFKLDTGAADVVLPSTALGWDMTEEQFVSRFHPVEHPIIGINRKAKMMAYDYIVEELHIKAFTLKKFPIVVCFDPNYQANLIGMSLIGLFDLHVYTNEKIVELVETPWSRPYIREGRPVIDAMKLAREPAIDFGEQIPSEEELAAIRIQRKLRESDQ